MTREICLCLLKLLTFATAVKLSFSNETYFASCPDSLRGMKSFNISQAAGKWYEVGRFGALPDYAGSCVRIEFQETNAIDSFATHVYHQHLGGWSKWHTKGTSSFRFTEKNADFQLVVDMTMFASVPFDYTILETDYETFGIFWACRYMTSEKHYEGLWILARTPDWSLENKNHVHEKLKAFGFDPQVVKPTVNTNC